jgi:FkbM family methyltransferase
LQRSFERSTLAAYERLVTAGALVIDVGANIGAHTLHLARAVGPSGRVLAYEPTERAFERLTSNIRLNPDLAPRIDAHQVMLLGQVEAALPAEVISSWPLRSDEHVHPTIRGRAVPTTGARVATLDALVRDQAGPIDLIKLDVDGYECDVLDGAMETLQRDRPIVLSEVAPFALEAAGRTVDELLQRFQNAGYGLETLRGKPVRRTDIADLERQRASVNVIARSLTARSAERS